MSVKESIGVIGMGLLLGGFGSVFLLNLFGVADEMGERAYRQSAGIRGIAPWKWIAAPDEHRDLLRSVRWARATGAGFALVGFVILAFGAVDLVRALDH